MPNTKPRGTDDEILLLIRMRREIAKEAMYKVVMGFIRFPVRLPALTVLFDYLSNMVLCLELMLKLLSDNWSSHDVGRMYETVFGCAFPKAEVMKSMEAAIKDQKYFVGPAGSIADYIPELEGLFDEIYDEVQSRFPTFWIEMDYDAPRVVGEFLSDNVGRFFHRNRKSGETHQEFMSAAQTEHNQIRQNIDTVLEHRHSIKFHIGRVSST